MLPSLIKVSRNCFEEFLDSHDNRYWNVYDETSSGAELQRRQATSEEIIELLEFYGTDDVVYIFGVFEDEPYDIANKTDFNNIPELEDCETIREYRVPTGGNDYLYFAYSAEQASNGQYLTLSVVEENE